MSWQVAFHPELYAEFNELPQVVQDAMLERAKFLQLAGPDTGRPWVDTLNDSRHSNMKELRFNAANGVWRVAFAFDPNRRAILLVAGDKSGTRERQFYRRLIRKADDRYDQHLEALQTRGTTHDLS